MKSKLEICVIADLTTNGRNLNVGMEQNRHFSVLKATRRQLNRFYVHISTNSRSYELTKVAGRVRAESMPDDNGQTSRITSSSSMSACEETENRYDERNQFNVKHRTINNDLMDSTLMLSVDFEEE